MDHIGFSFLILSAISLLISMFLPWTGSYSVYEMYALFQYLGTVYIFLFPFLCVGLILGSVLGLAFTKPPSHKFFYIILFLAADLLFIFLYQMLDFHGTYLWKYSGIYIAILSLIALLIGFLLKLIGVLQGNPSLN